MALGRDSTLLQKAATRVGFLVGDALRITAGTSAGTLPRSRYASRGETLRLCPAVARSGMRGAWVNYDGPMVDDARMVTAVDRTAAREGARILTYCEATRASGDEVVLRNRLGAGS